MVKDGGLINPYDLLGVKINSTLSEIKKAYYNLALLCHPDKGGCKKDMDTIHQAYKYVIEQVNNINKKLLMNMKKNLKILLMIFQFINYPLFPKFMKM